MATYSYTKYIDDDRLALEICNSTIITALNSVIITGEKTVDIIFKAALSTQDKAMLDDIVNSHINQPITVRDSVILANVDITSNAEKAIKTAPTKLEGSSTHLISHDFCDDTTWYGDSKKVENEILTSSDGVTFKSAHTSWIDLEHGKVPYEDRLAPHYKPVIKVNGMAISEGFTIDYKKGEITFSSSKSGATVSAGYSYASGSTWKIVPDTGRILKILGTTIKFTSDVVLGDGQSIKFQLYVGGQPYGEPTVYKNIRDIIKCTMVQPSSLQGFSDVSGIVNILPFDYITSKDIKSSLGMEIRIWLSNHKVCSGEFGVVTANCLSVKE